MLTTKASVYFILIFMKDLALIFGAIAFQWIVVVFDGIFVNLALY
jgi:hypothetical protein